MEDMEVEESAEEQLRKQEERRLVRAEFRKLHYRSNIQDESKITLKDLKQLIDDNERLYDKVVEVEEAVADSRIIRNISRLYLKQTDAMSTNAMEFRHHEYAAKLVRKMKGGTKDGEVRMGKLKLAILGKDAMTLFNRSPAFTYMKGALRHAPVEKKQRKARESKRKSTKMSDLVSTQAVNIEETETTGAQTQQMVVHTLTCLIMKYKENSRKPLHYFRFAMSPTSFGDSVENMFHISFLIKEGKAKILLLDGVPHIKPVKPKKNAESFSGRDEEMKNQTVINFNMYQWERMVKALDLKESMISAINV